MNDSEDLLDWLERVHRDKARAVTDPDHAFSIESIDNPGWLVKADLRQFAPSPVADQSIRIVGDPPRAENGNIGGAVWMVCEIKSGEFIGAGDPSQLRTILGVLRGFVTKGSP